MMEERELLADVYFYPLAKGLPEGAADAEDAGEEAQEWPFEGVASDASQDVEGDEILHRALDLTYADSRGFVNWEHSKEPENQIGYLKEAKLIAPGQVKSFEKRLGIKLSKTASVFVKGALYKYVEKSQAVANLMKSAPAGRGLGLSLQGALARDADDGNILKAFVRGVAVTTVPAHPRTLAVLAKSLREGAQESPATPGSVSDAVRQYVDEVVTAALRKDASGATLTKDEAVLKVLQHFPSATLGLAERIVNLAMKRS